MIRLRTLGGLSVEDASFQGGAATRRRPLAILAILATAGSKGMSRDRLIALLWPESDEQHARNSLNQALSSLRRDLGADDVVRGTAELRLNEAVITSDVQEFSARLDEGDDERGASLYGGQFLDGVFLKGAPDFEHWIDLERRRLQDRYVAALGRLRAAAAARGDRDAAVRWARARADIAPLESRATLEVMRSLTQAGDPAGALRQFEAHQALLREEVGVRPEAELLALAERIRRGVTANELFGHTGSSANGVAGGVLVPPETITSGDGIPPMPELAIGGPASFRKALLFYAIAFVAVAVLAKAAIVVIGLPDWVFPGALTVMGLVLPVVLFTGHLSWQRTARVGAYALGAFVLVIGAFMELRERGLGPAGSLLGAGKLTMRDQILVADFRASAANAALGEGLADALRASLAESRVVRLMSPTEIGDVLQRMKRPLDSRIDAALAREIAAREGAKATITGDVTPLTGGYLITARLVGPSGEALATFQETADGLRDLVPAMDRLGRDVRGKVGESLRSVHATPPLVRVTTASLEALRKYTEGKNANDVELNLPKAISLLEEAIAQDSSFAMAYRTLANAMRNSGVRTERIPGVLEKAMRYIDRLPEDERLALTGRYYEDGPHADRARAVAAYELLFRRYPEWKVLITQNNLAMMYGSRREFARAESLYKDIMQVAPNEAPPYGNIMGIHISQGKFAEARQGIARLRARTPGAPAADRDEARILYIQGNRDSARVFLERGTRPPVTRRTANAHLELGSLAFVEGRINEAWKELVAARDVNATRGNPPPVSLADSLIAAQVLLAVFDRPADALRTIDAALARSPNAPRPFPLLVALYAMAGKPDRARAEYARYDASVSDTARRRLDAPARHEAVGWIALAQGRHREAIIEFRASDMLPDGPANACTICMDPQVGRAFDRAGMPDSAIVAFEHFLNTPFPNRLTQDRFDRAWITRRLGELYEAKGNSAKAVEYYGKFVELWKSADPALLPQVELARQRIAKLKEVVRREVRKAGS